MIYKTRDCKGTNCMIYVNKVQKFLGKKRDDRALVNAGPIDEYQLIIKTRIE